MIFAGDIALPHKNAIDYADIPNELLKKNWYANLEGAVVPDDKNQLNAVFNHQEAITQLLHDFNLKGVSLANNHIFDTGSLKETIRFLNAQSIDHGGVGSTLSEANNEI